MPGTRTSRMLIVDADWAESEQVMVDQFYDLCDAALVAAQHRSPRAVRLLDAARRLAGWFPQWLATDLEIDSYLDHLQLVVDVRRPFGTGKPAA